jgi:hypothetical protein
MNERDVFEQRLEAAVREFVETAPDDIDAARLTHSLATSVPRVRRIAPRPIWKLPNLGPAWIPIAAILAAAMGIGLLATGALRDTRPGPAQTTPTFPVETVPAVIASPFASPVATAPPSPASPSPSLSASPTPSPSPPASPTASSAPSATAGSPQDVTITSLMVIPATGPNTGTFDARGGAGASGLICQHGTVEDLVTLDREALASGRLLDFTVPKEFSCDDGGGTFVVELVIHTDPLTKAETFTWRVLRGTAAYARLQGGGTGTTLSPGPSQALNTYTGTLVP